MIAAALELGIEVRGKLDVACLRLPE